WAFAQIERVGESDSVYLILLWPKKETRPDLRVGDLHMTGRKCQGGLVIFRNLAAEFESSAQFEFCVPIVIKRQRECSRCENKICVKKERILVQNFASVTAL